MSPNSHRYHVFLSYSSKDRDFVLKLANSLRRRHFKVFLDQWRIHGGDSVRRALRQALELSDHILLVMSPNWLASEWTTLEADTVVMDDPGASRQKIIPLLLTDCEIPNDLRRLKFIDFRDPYYFQRSVLELVVALKAAEEKRILAKFIASQRQTVLNSLLLPWIPHFSPSFDFIWPELFVDPPVIAHRHVSPRQRLGDWLLHHNWQSNIALIGNAGIGKSTAIKSILLRKHSIIQSYEIRTLSLHIHASDILRLDSRGLDSHLGLIEQLSGVQLTKSLARAIAKYIDNILLLVDGLDELSELDAVRTTSTLIVVQRNITRILAWVACRSDYFNRLIVRNPSFSHMFYEVLELRHWDPEGDAIPFVNNFAERTKDQETRSRLEWIVDSHDNLDEFLRSPLELTLLVYLQMERGQLSAYAPRNTYELYEAFYREWIKREQRRGMAGLSEAGIEALHTTLAHNLYEGRGSGQLLSEILDRRKLEVNAVLIKSVSAFVNLLEVTTVDGSDDIRIWRFRHETLAEYLIAKSIKTAFLSDAQQVKELLQTIYRYEVNVLVRESIALLSPQERSLVLQHLKEAYIDLCSQDDGVRSKITRNIETDGRESGSQGITISQDIQHIKVREQILYYIGRNRSPGSLEVLRFAFVHEPRPLLRRIAALGAILHGDEEVEANYISQLIPGSNEDLLNRSVQLVYFGDAYGDLHEYKDDLTCDWSKTRSAILQRLKGDSERDIRLRWWDFRTLFLFLTSRNRQTQLTRDQITIIKECNTVDDAFSKGKQEYLQQDKQRILSLIDEGKQEY